jgi:hypothetical protein
MQVLIMHNIPPVIFLSKKDDHVLVFSRTHGLSARFSMPILMQPSDQMVILVSLSVMAGKVVMKTA